MGSSAVVFVCDLTPVPSILFLSLQVLLAKLSVLELCGLVAVKRYCSTWVDGLLVVDEGWAEG